MPKPVSGINGVLKRMRALDKRLRPDDGVRWFNRLYLEVTERVAAELDKAAGKRPTFLERLDVVFANAYFEALDAAGASSKLPKSYPHHAWKPLFESRSRLDIAPIQFALAGMNAHINFDLAIGIDQTCAAIGTQPRRGSAEYKEYVGVNKLLKEAQQAAEQWLLTDALAELNRHFSPIDDIVAIWSVTQARDAAWSHAEVLSTLKDQSVIERNFVEILNRSTGMASRALLGPQITSAPAPRPPAGRAPARARAS
jgi:hypothetical protein